MKIQTFALILALAIEFSSTASNGPILETIDLELDTNKKYLIKSKDEGPISYFLNYNSVRTILPKKHFDLIKGYMETNGFKCKRKYVYSGGFYETFYCYEKNSVDFSKVKLNLNFENYTLTMTEDQLFETEGDKHYSKLRTQSGTSMIMAGISKRK